MSALPLKADIPDHPSRCPLCANCGHCSSRHGAGLVGANHSPHLRLAEAVVAILHERFYAPKTPRENLRRRPSPSASKRRPTLGASHGCARFNWRARVFLASTIKSWDRGCASSGRAANSVDHDFALRGPLTHLDLTVPEILLSQLSEKLGEGALIAGKCQEPKIIAG